MLNRKTPDTLAVDLTVSGQGEKFTVPVVFHNKRQSEINEYNAVLTEKAKEVGLDEAWVNREQFLFIVKEFNGCDKFTNDDVLKLEEDYPGILIGVFFRYHDARRVEVVKN